MYIEADSQGWLEGYVFDATPFLCFYISARTLADTNRGCCTFFFSSHKSGKGKPSVDFHYMSNYNSDKKCGCNGVVITSVDIFFSRGDYTGEFGLSCAPSVVCQMVLSSS